MPKCLLLALAASALHAAVMRGVVVDHQSGRPVARARVVVQPVAGGSGRALGSHTDVNGAFEFPSLPPGAYLVSAARTGYAPAQHGQKQWNSAGAPVSLDDSAPTVLKIRLKRFGAISGAVVDENEVGLAEHTVVAYRNTRPLRLVARAVTDDRGVYRIFGLEPGAYLVRTAAKQHEAGGYLPTFSHEAAVVEQAQSVEVVLDETTDHVNIKPFPGRLVTLAGRVYTSGRRPVTLTLISDAARETVTTSDNFQFNPVAPGQYELFAISGNDARYSVVASYTRLSVDTDRTDLRINPIPIAGVPFQFQTKAGENIDPVTVRLLARHKTMEGEGPAQDIRLLNDRAMLPPGRWDVSVDPGPSWCAAGFSGPKADGGASGRADGWNEILVGAGDEPARFILSSTCGSVHGTVTSEKKPAAGAPVFLEVYDPESGRRLVDLRAARTDEKGKFQFAGLAPGNYRLLATFEHLAPDSAMMAVAGARALQVEEGRDCEQDVELYVIR